MVVLRLCWLLLLTMAFTASAQSNDKLSLLILSTDFVAPVKFTRLVELGAQASIDVHTFSVESDSKPATETLKELLARADLVVLDGPRPSDQAVLQAALQALAEAGPATDVLSSPWLQIGGGRPTFAGLATPLAGQLISYYQQGGVANYRLFMQALQRWQQGLAVMDMAPASQLPVAGLYTPTAVYSDLQSWFAEQPQLAEQPLVGFMISDNSLRNLQTGLLDSIYQQSLAAGLTPVLFWFDQANEQALQQFWQTHQATALVNLTHLQNGDARRHEFAQLDVPVLQASSYRDGNVEQWRAASQGRDSGAFATLQVIPESWGVSDPVLIAAMADGEPALIDSQFRLLTDKVKALVKLQRAANADKQVAIMYWNTPAGEENLSASNLNVPRSVVAIAQAMKQADYDVELKSEQQVITTAKQLLAGLYHPQQLPQLAQQQHTLSLSLAAYQRWFAQLPDTLQQQLLAQWGDPAQHRRLFEQAGEPQFLIPAVRWGKLWLLPQPPRAGKVGANTHDAELVPDHYYLAAYLALRQQGIDALIHLGTHGSQEWLPGKARDLSADDYPLLTLGALPVFYPYIQDNVSEALQARRRGRAVTISHQTPAFAPSGLYDDLLSLHELIHDYEQVAPGQVKQQLTEQLLAQAEAMQLTTELGYSAAQAERDFADFYQQLHDHLHRLAASVTPLGLHTFGQPAPPSQRLLTVLQQLGKDYIRAAGDDPAELLAASPEQIQQSRAVSLLRQALTADNDDSSLPSELAPWFEKARTNDRWLAQTDELQALLHGLNGGFVQAGLGGDPIRQPDTTSGTNLYAFDPRKIPTAAAYQAAAETFQQLLDNYADEHGRLPKKLAFSLWSGETQRHLGVVEGQVLRALGLAPEWDSSGRLQRLRIIPQTELKQPRIDVVLQVTSVYRDQFDGFMRLLADAIARLAQLDDGNAIASNSQRLALQLQQQGLSTAEAQRYAQLRLFSNAPGDYGSGVPDVTLASTAWDDDSVIAEQFLSRLQYAYGADQWGVKLNQQNLFASQLGDVDAAVMSRSSNLHGLLSTDHPFEYLGGIAAAVRQLSGRDIGLYINDLRQTQGRVVGADRFISEELRSRYLNPQWIEQMQAEGYAGALTMLDTVNNLFGWQATAPQTVRDDQWQALHDVYIADKYDMQLNQWFEQQQAAAQMQIIERMAEAIRKQYWQADAATQQSLAERYQALRALQPQHQTDATTQAYLEQMAGAVGTGFGLQAGVAAAAASSAVDAPTSHAPAQLVSGQQLQRQSSNAVEPQWPWRQTLLLLLLTLLVVLGALTQARKH